MGNKVIAIGDIHGSTKWKDITRQHGDASIVFLGDYLDPYGGYDCGEILDNLVDLIEFKRNNHDRVVLLLGNHDLHYISSDAAIGTRFDYRLAKKAGDLFRDNIQLFQYAYQIGDVVFTHAGISHRWFVQDFKGNLCHDIAAQLNHPTDEQIKALFRVGTARGGKANRHGGIFWADRSELTDPLHGFTQVVGHNRVMDIKDYVYSDNNRIIFCDCLAYEKYLEWNLGELRLYNGLLLPAKP